MSAIGFGELQSKTERVLCPVSCLATRSGTPWRAMVRIAVRRNSWGIRPGQPAPIHAAFPPFVNARICFGCFGPRRPLATIRQKHPGAEVPGLRNRRPGRLLRLQQRAQVVGHGETRGRRGSSLGRCRSNPRVGRVSVDRADHGFDSLTGSGRLGYWPIRNQLKLAA